MTEFYQRRGFVDVPFRVFDKNFITEVAVIRCTICRFGDSDAFFVKGYFYRYRLCFDLFELQRCLVQGFLEVCDFN